MSETLQLIPRRSLKSAMMFSALAPQLQARLREAALARRFEDGQIIQQRGDAARGFWLIEEGGVAVGQFLETGEFRQVALLGAGDSYGELALLAGRPRVVDALARGPAVLRHIDGAAFERALAQDGAAMRAVLGTMAAQLQEALDIMASNRRGSAARRTAGLLANLCAGASGEHRVSVTQQEIADLLGVTRATANAALRQLEDAGLIERSYGAICVPAPARLRGRALE